MKEELQLITEKRDEKKNGNNSGEGGVASLFLRLGSRAFLKPFSSVGVLYGLCQFNGTAPLVVYMKNVFQDSGTDFDASLAPMLVGIIQVGNLPCIYRSSVQSQTSNMLVMLIGGMLEVINGNSDPVSSIPVHVKQAPFVAGYLCGRQLFTYTLMIE